MNKNKSIKNKPKKRAAKRGHGRDVSVSRSKRLPRGDMPSYDGELDCFGDRFAFLPTADGSDIFISGSNLGGARHGDRVRVDVIGDRSMHGALHREGVVTDILERNPLSIVATVVCENGRYFAVPDNKRYGSSLPLDVLGGASELDKVIIDVVPDDCGDSARVLSVLGRYDEIGMDVMSVIISHGLRTEFPADVIAEADAFPDTIDEGEASASCRRDFRGDIVFTIDGSDSKDFDDAVSLVETDGGYRLGVYIADVSQYVTAGSALDREAYERGTSVYLADRVLPMLPERLSNGLCSLNEGEDRLVLCAIIDLDGQGNVVKSEVCEGVIRSAARLTYTGVQAALDGDREMRERYAAVYPTLVLMNELAKKRIAIRKRRGAVDFDLTETEIKFDAAGHVKDIAKKPSLMSMKIIEEFMILANCAVAERFCKYGVPFVYRVHDRPAPDKLDALNDFLETLGISERIGAAPQPGAVAGLLSGINERSPELSGAVSRVALRAMAKAVYEPVNGGHFGLAEKFYCHFTSPIRRYPDLAIHRIIKAYLHGGKSAAMSFRDFAASAAERSSRTERVAALAERDVDDLKKAEYMSGHIGERFTGTISSVTEFGFFVELENSAEGLVHISTLPPASRFDGRRLSISCGMKSFRIGDTVDIIVKNVEGSRIDFVLS